MRSGYLFIQTCMQRRFREYFPYKTGEPKSTDIKRKLLEKREMSGKYRVIYTEFQIKAYI